MSDLGRILVLAGGLSHERDVSLRSGRRVCEALRSVGVDADVRDVDPSLLTWLADERPAAVFAVLHGVAGEDGAVSEVLELLGLSYVGSPPAACRAAFDKPLAKAAVLAAGLQTPEAVALPHAMFRELGAAAVLDALVERLGLPLIVKPARGGSALGVSAVRDAATFPAAMVAAFAYGDTALIERLISGTEIAVSVVETDGGPITLPPVEIVPEGQAYDYAARYTAGTTEFFVPARLAPDVAAAASAAALTAHRVLGLRDLSRTDLVIGSEGIPWFLEVNVAPGLTETSLLPQAAAASGMEIGVLYRDLCARAAARPPRRLPPR